MHRRAHAFTLLEIMMAISIAVLLLLIAVPSLTALFAEEGLQKTFEEFDAFVQKAQERAVTDKRAVLLVWTKEGIETVVDAPEQPDAAGGETLAFPADGSITIDRPAALNKKAPMEWAFWPSGACEPVRVYYESRQGSWVADYEPLTGRAKIFAMQTK